MKWITLSLATAAAATVMAGRPDLNSFINRPIHSVSDLVQQINNDPEVADRYERNFSMTKDQVIEMVKGLHADHLREAQVYNVYSVPPDGHIKWHLQRLKKGLPIFSDSAGNPVLVEKCGNPLVMVSPTPSGPAPSGPTAPLVPMTTAPGEEIHPEMAMAPPLTPEDVYVPPVAEAIPPAAAPFVGTGGAGSPNYSWLAVVPIGGLIYGLTTIHGHSTPPPAPVPEPAPFALMAIGGAGLLVARRRSVKK